MESPVPRPETINKLIFAAHSAFAMLAGMQLDATPIAIESVGAVAHESASFHPSFTAVHPRQPVLFT